MEDPLASVCVFALAQGASPPTVLRMHDCVRCREMSHMLCIRNSYEEKNKKSPAKLQTGWIESRSSPLLLSETGLLTQTLEPHWVFYALNPEKPGPQCMLGRNFTATHGLQLGLGSASTLFRQSLFVNEKDDSLLCSFPFFFRPHKVGKVFSSFIILFFLESLTFICYECAQKFDRSYLKLGFILNAGGHPSVWLHSMGL